MIVKDKNEIAGVDCPRGGFTSIRYLVESDCMGFSLHETTIHPFQGPQRWHYKNHLEACYCVSGCGLLRSASGKKWIISPGMIYALDKHDEHWFEVIGTTPVVLVCVFNPPVKGMEVHHEDGSYAI